MGAHWDGDERDRSDDLQWVTHGYDPFILRQ